MWRVGGCVFVVLASIVVGCVATTDVAAMSDEMWLSNSVTKLAETPSGSVSLDAPTCAGRESVIEVVGRSGYSTACVFGDSATTRLARYRDAVGQYAYVFAFPSDTKFKEVRGLCAGRDRCVYGQASDTLLLQMPVEESKFTHALVKDFSKRLVKESSGESAYYRFEQPTEYTYLRAGDAYVSTESVGISSNGRWAFLELTGYGFVRLDMKSLAYTRIGSHDSILRQRIQPLEIGVSDDGRWAMVIGFRDGALLYETDGRCGDTLSGSSGMYFADGTIVCSSVFFAASAQFLGLSAIHTPRFSPYGARVIVEAKRGAQNLTVTFAPSPAVSGSPSYLSFGDSFTSGEGESKDSFYINATNTATNKCHVSSRSYPYLLGSSWEYVTSNLACSGSRIQGVREASKGFLSRADGVGPSVVSLGIGGNDVDFMGKLKSCIGIGTCEWALERTRKATAYEIRSLLPRVVDILNELKVNLSPAPLFLVGYPSVINDHPDARCSALVSQILDADERMYMSESIKYINRVLKAAADYAKVTFIDIEQAYQGERLCDQHESAMNSVRYGDDIAPIPMMTDFKLVGAESFHPTPRGHQLAALMINARLGSFWSSPACIGCQFSETDLNFSNYWLEGAGFDESISRQLADIFLGAEKYIDTTNASFSFLPNTFEAGSTIVFELHSEIRRLGEFKANADGSAAGTLTLPVGIEGYHTVHAYGKSPSGEDLDIYQTVYIDTNIASSNGATKEKTDDMVATILGLHETPVQPSPAPAITFESPGEVKDASTLGAANKVNSLRMDEKRTSGEETTGNSVSLYVIALAIFGSTFIITYVLLRRKHKNIPG